MAMKGWRRIGIVLSVLAFFPLGIFIWGLPSGSESVYQMQVKNYGLLWRAAPTLRHIPLS